MSFTPAFDRFSSEELALLKSVKNPIADRLQISMIPALLQNESLVAELLKTLEQSNHKPSFNKSN